MINENSTDLEIFHDYEIDISGLETCGKHRGIVLWRYPRDTPKESRPRYTYYAVIRFKDSYAILKGITLLSIKTQIGRCRNGLKPHDCSICVYHIPRTPIMPDHCHWTIDPDMTGFYGCPRFEPR